MESKFIKRLNNVEKSYIDDLTFIIKDITDNYTIQDYNSNKLDYDYFKKKYLEQKEYQCTAITTNMKRCCMKSNKETGYMYCKKHAFKMS